MPLRFVMLSPSLAVILSAAKNLDVSLRINSAKHLMRPFANAQGDNQGETCAELYYAVWSSQKDRGEGLRVTQRMYTSWVV